MYKKVISVSKDDNILIIDDELIPRVSIKMVLKDKYFVHTASSGQEGLNLMLQYPINLVVLDIKMPDMDGIAVLREIKKKHPDTEVILLTAYASIDSARNAVQLGALDYLMKPFDKDAVLNVVEKGLQKNRTKKASIQEKEELIYKTRSLESEITKAQQELIRAYEGTVKALIRAIDAKDHYTFDHSDHVTKLAVIIADALGISENMKNKIRYGGIIHDIGKIGIEEVILGKPGKLTTAEYEKIKEHPEIGAMIVNAVPFLEEIVPIVLYHHEKYDGSGYPKGLKADNVPMAARIITIADAIDAMMSDRPYRKALSMDKIISELKNGTGSQFDPLIVELIFKEQILFIFYNTVKKKN